ncbi:MAG: hypothetical protein M3121_01145 [Chloroflexota bacterium]|nr:hypothetical protein [Chloroflexota bacterium]
MIDIIKEKQQGLQALCRQLGIVKLDIFDSAVTDAFDPQTSDLDFIIDVGEYERGVHKRSFGFAEALETLFGRSVDDLIDPVGRDHPYFLAEVNETRTNFYAVEDCKASA